jgi:hypothetical protein
MADDVIPTASSQSAAVSTALPTRTESRADRARRLAYRNRFSFLFVALSVVAGIAVGALIVQVSRGGPAPPPAWSAWKPTGSTERRSAQIGEYVSDPYLLPSGNPLVAVIYAGQPTVTGPDGSTFLVRALAVRPDTTGGRAEATDIDTIDASKTVMFTLWASCFGVRRSSSPSTR